MRPYTPICFLIAMMLVACSDKPSLPLQDKAKYTAELIAERSECKTYLQKLSPPVADEKIIDQTYRAAKSAHCLKPDV